ncbi:hypothetical protein BgAZ_201630 [Babesia gibsoni]|uniref:Uncharacterized protein n=1 Tax=Babesia gibsoni TaxID=33632 RepID=A0AAD8LKJ3_BABGI|nr:hypothetical protein BgAZ_201630 [Babesia gibsoni]
MRQRLTKSIPPWEIASRLAYKRQRSLSAGQKLYKPGLYALFNKCTKAIAGEALSLRGYEIDEQNTIIVVQESDPDFPSSNLLEEVNVKLQHLSHFGLNKRDKKVLIEFIQRIEPHLTEPKAVFKFLCSVSSIVSIRCLPKGNSIKSACRPSFESLFKRIDRSTNPYHAVTCYLKLCAFYGQKVSILSDVYHSMVTSFISDSVFTTEEELDQLIFLYERLSICDNRVITYCSKRMARHFDNFTENQICNFARYLVKSVHASNRPDVIGAPPDYSKEYTRCEASEILDGFDVVASDYVKCLEGRLPVCLHQYSYFNLIDMGEFYHVFGIESDVRTRFSTELWKYLYTLKYGYPIKSLVVLSKLGLGDTKTFGRLIRNIPQTLAFRWPLSLVAECLINLEGGKKEKIYVILAHYISKSLSKSFDGHNIARVFDSLRDKRVPLLGLYHKVLGIQDSNTKWLTPDHLFSIARYGKDVGLSVHQVFNMLRSSDISNVSPHNAITLLDLMESIDEDLLRRCVTVLYENRNVTPLGFGSFMELLKACKRLKLRISFIQELAINALKEIETIEMGVFLEFMDLLSSCGPIDNQCLMGKLYKFIQYNLEHIPLHSTGRLLWLCFSLGFPINGECFQSLLRRFNKLYDPKYNEDHLLQVLGAVMMKLDSHSSEMRMFLRNLDNFKDVSWRRDAAEVAKIKELNKHVNCATFVPAFPFTADAEIGIEELHSYIEKKGQCAIDPKGEKLDTQLQHYPEADQSTVYLDLTDDPFVKVVDNNCRITQSLSFYHQVR